jgi:hypothetical protein
MNTLNTTKDTYDLTDANEFMDFHVFFGDFNPRIVAIGIAEQLVGLPFSLFDDVPDDAATATPEYGNVAAGVITGCTIGTDGSVMLSFITPEENFGSPDGWRESSLNCRDLGEYSIHRHSDRDDSVRSSAASLVRRYVGHTLRHTDLTGEPVTGECIGFTACGSMLHALFAPPSPGEACPVEDAALLEHAEAIGDSAWQQRTVRPPNRVLRSPMLTLVELDSAPAEDGDQ